MSIFRFAAPIRRVACLLLLALAVTLACGAADSLLAAGGGEGGGTGWVKTDTARVMNFALLALLLFLVLRKRLPGALNSRIKGIREELAELEAKKAAAEQQLAEYNEKLSELEKEAERIVQEYVRQGNEAKARILKEAEASAEKLKQQARRTIEHEFEQVKNGLQAEVLEAALRKAEEIIRGQITASDQDQLVDEYLKKVVAR